MTLYHCDIFSMIMWFVIFFFCYSICHVVLGAVTSQTWWTPSSWWKTTFAKSQNTRNWRWFRQYVPARNIWLVGWSRLESRNTPAVWEWHKPVCGHYWFFTIGSILEAWFFISSTALNNVGVLNSPKHWWWPEISILGSLTGRRIAICPGKETQNTIKEAENRKFKLAFLFDLWWIRDSRSSVRTAKYAIHYNHTDREFRNNERNEHIGVNLSSHKQ